MNITLGIVILFIIIKAITGYHKGMVREIADCIALVVTLVVVAILLMIYLNFRNGETIGTIVMVILLVIIGIIYGLIKMCMKSAKTITKLPILNSIDSILGIFVGALSGILIIWIVVIISRSGFLGGIGEKINEDISRSHLLQVICEYNYVINVFKKS